MAEWVRKVNQLTGWSSNRFRQVLSVKGIQIWRTQAKKCFPEWSGSASEFFRDSRISATKGINFFVCVQDFFDEALSPQYGARYLGRNGIKGNVLRGWDLKNRLEAWISLLLPEFYEICFTRIAFVATKTLSASSFKFWASCFLLVGTKSSKAVLSAKIWMRIQL